MPCGIGIEEIHSALFGKLLGYSGLLSVFSITGPHHASIKAKEYKDTVDIDGIVVFPATVHWL